MDRPETTPESRPETLFEQASYDLKQFRERRLADRRFTPRGTIDRRATPLGQSEQQSGDAATPESPAVK